MQCGVTETDSMMSKQPSTSERLYKCLAVGVCRMCLAVGVGYSP
jgi:hypothetical protein